jgi:LCP family protein required for cell wall assembly
MSNTEQKEADNNGTPDEREIDNNGIPDKKETAIDGIPRAIEPLEDDSHDIIICQDEYDEDEAFVSESLKQQVMEELDRQAVAGQENSLEDHNRRTGRWKKALWISGIVLGVLLLLVAFLAGTHSGRKILYRIASGFIYENVDKEAAVEAATEITPGVDNTSPSDTTSMNPENSDTANSVSQKPTPIPRSEEYVSNYLIFGVEEIEGAKNTDSMMLVSVNTMDDTVKLTSLLRDTYVEVDGMEPNKLNAVYAMGGAESLVKAIEKNYRIKLDGYAYINFEAFESIIDYIGGIGIELGEEEAHYLNTTNYISKRENRNVVPGWNQLNGNQALGYCRVRKCVTLGGANDDYGRTLRQRRVLKAIFEQYKSKNAVQLLFMADDLLGYVKTNLNRDQIEKLLENIVENKIQTMDTLRVPVDQSFETPDVYHGIHDPLLIDWDKNIIELYQFLFLDSEEQAREALGTN